MKHTQHTLLIAFTLPIAAIAAMVALFETDTLPCGLLADDKSADFVAAIAMELLTIAVIPLALKLFKLRPVARMLTGARPLLRLGLCRILLLALPMLANAVLYYLFMNVAFGYMGIILLLCMAFVVPTKARCYSEVHTDDA